MFDGGTHGEAQVLLDSPEHEHELEGLVVPAVAAVEGGAPAEQHVGQLGRLYVEKIIRINLKIESFCELFICTKSLFVEETGEFSSRQTTKRQFSIVLRTSLQAGSVFFNVN